MTLSKNLIFASNAGRLFGSVEGKFGIISNMGQPMPDIPIEYDDDCLLGFPAGETPKYLYVRFSKVAKCPDEPPDVYPIPPNDRVFKLTQRPDSPCVWEYESADWYLQFIVWGPEVYTEIILWTADRKYVVFYNDNWGPPDEGFVYHHDRPECLPGIPAAGGFAVVTWNPQATKLLEDINMEKARDLFMELRPLDDGKLVYKFCRLQDATNIAILFEP
ncbi:unnamed protein product [marine sediment metagenome]|uniref:Uncharacterized protein n=2 Tax=marine sediment metagenome TaxID=412755 RepID=X1K2W7_9ZZZZ